MDGRLWAAWVLMSLCTGHPVDITQDIDVGQDRKLLGSSVVTSVSVIMDHGNGTKTFITDSEQAPSIPRPEIVGTPGTLMAPDRYEFYSFGKDGELVKKLMSLEEIQGLIAAGDELNSSEEGLPVYYHEPLVQAGEPEGVSKVLESVQNVLKGELQNMGTPEKIALPPLPDDSWSLLLSGLLSGDLDLKEAATKKPLPRPKPQVQYMQTTTKPTTIYKPTIPFVRLTTTKQTTKHSAKPIQYKPTAKPIYNHSALPTSRRPYTTVKYSAHYSTPPPNLTSKNPQPTKPTKKQPPITKRPEISSTYRSTTKETYQTPVVTEKTRPSGIPTITHYLPIQSSKPSSHFPTSSPLTTQKITTTKTVGTTTTKTTSNSPKTPISNTQKTTVNLTKIASKPTQATTKPTQTTSKPTQTTTKPTQATTKPTQATTKPTQTTTKTTPSTVKTTIVTTKKPTATTTQKSTTTQPPTTRRIITAQTLSTRKPVTTQKPTTQEVKTQETQKLTTMKPTTSKATTTTVPTTITTTVSYSSTEQQKKTSVLPEAEKLVDIKVPLDAESSNIESVKIAMPESKITTSAPLTTKVQLPVLTTIKQKPDHSTHLPISTTSTVSSTTPPKTTETISTQATTMEVKSTIVTETMPTTMLEEIPLKLYESLKDPQNNVFAMPSLLDTTTYRETTEMSTTITDETNSSDSTTTTDASNFRTEKIPETTKVQITTTVLDSTTETPTTQNFETTELSGTTYKDKVMEDGISAVTNILLDMHKGLMQNNSEPDTTTENEETSETIDQTDMPTSTTNLKTEMRTEDYETSTTMRITTEIVTEVPVKINETKNNTKPLIPIKESKLNPETLTEAQPELTLKNEPTTLKPEIKEKTAPKENEKINRYKTPAYQTEHLQPPPAIDLHPAPYESMGLEASTAFLSEDVRRFADLCNELAFRLWTSLTGKGQISSRSLVLSPFAATSLLAMVFLGARGATSGQMNDILRLDDMVTFNPHQVLQNVTDSVLNSKNHGVATAAFVRELYSDKAKGKLLDFYKERAQQYYQGHVEELNFHTIGDIIRRRTNLLIKRQTLGKVPEYMRGSSLQMRPPLAAFSANIFQTDCEQGSTEGRDGEMYFVVRPSTRQRRLVPVPAVVWRSGFLAGYEPSLDATSVSLGPDSVVSTILVLPGQQGQVAPGDGLARLEQRLIETSYRRGGWSRLLRSLLLRPGLELQVPRFSHRSVLNVTTALQRMGLKDLFDNKADLRGLNGLSNDLHLSDMVQVNTFSTCGEETIGARHHIETYPASPQRVGRDDPEYYPPKDFENSFANIPLSLRPRQARLPDSPRLRFDRPFLYLVRHNPSGMILHMGRFNPRLLP